jgi:hypothetical protein
VERDTQLETFLKLDFEQASLIKSDILPILSRSKSAQFDLRQVFEINFFKIWNSIKIVG